MLFVATYISLVIIWLLYIVTMAALRVWNDLHWFVRLNLLPIGAVFITLDVLVNITVATILFFDLPRYWTLSGRLNNYATTASGARTSAAAFICRNILNPFDKKGHHCGRR